MPIEFSQDKDSLTLRAVIKDRNGNDAPVQNPVWNTSDTNLLELTPNGNTITLTHPARHNSGICSLTLEGDADMGDGVEPIGHSEEVSITLGKAASIAFEVIE
jgi:hypothetical protein